MDRDAVERQKRVKLGAKVPAGLWDFGCRCEMAEGRKLRNLSILCRHASV